MTAGAIRAHREGIVTACSIVANGAAFRDAVAQLRDAPSLEVGVHLTLVEERALTTGEKMPRDYVRFLLSRRVDVEPELRAQVEKVIGTGLRVTHLNGHQHLHMLPRVRRVVEQLAREYGIGYIRVVNDRGGRTRRLSIAALNALGDRGRYTIGVAEAGHLTASRIIELFEHVAGVTELVAHPGISVSGYPHWGYAWEEETRALCDPAVLDAIVVGNIELIAPSALRSPD